MTAPRRSAVTFTVRGPIACNDLPGLYDRVCGLLARAGPAVAYCEVCGVLPDAVTVDALARLQLAARRYGCEIRVRGLSASLRELIVFTGLDDLLADD